MLRTTREDRSPRVTLRRLEPPEKLVRERDVGADLALERVGIRKLQLIPEAPHEAKTGHALSRSRCVIEQVGFDGSSDLTEGWSDAHVRDGVHEGASVQSHPCQVNAIGGNERVVGQQVQGRHGDLGATPPSGDDPSVDLIATSEQPPGAANVSAENKLSDAGAADGLSAFEDRRDRDDLEVIHSFFKSPNIAAVPMTKPEVVTNADGPRTKMIDQEGLHELLRAQPGERIVKTLHDQDVEARFGEQGDLLIERAQRDRRVFGGEDFERMGIEGDRHRGASRILCPPAQSVEYCGMPTVKSVKVPDRDHAPVESRGLAKAAYDFHVYSLVRPYTRAR